MKRKIIRQGHNTLTVTLPAKWVKHNNILPGAEVDIDESNARCLRISPSGGLCDAKKIIDFDVSGLDQGTIRQKLRSAYKLGYREIGLRFEKNIVKELRTGEEHAIMALVNHEVSNLIGCAVITQTDESCRIRDYAIDSDLEFNTTLRRIFFLIDEYGQSFLQQVKDIDIESLKGMRERHFNIAKFIFYCQRLINQGAVPENDIGSSIYYIIAELDEILDILKYAAMDFLELKTKKLTKDTIQIMEMILLQNKQYMDYFYKPSKKNLVVLAESRWTVRKNIKKFTTLPKDELCLLHDLSFISELYYHLVEARMRPEEDF